MSSNGYPATSYEHRNESRLSRSSRQSESGTQHPHGPGLPGRTSSGDDRVFPPFTKGVDSEKSMDPPYPRTLAVPFPIGSISGQSRSDRHEQSHPYGTIPLSSVVSNQLTLTPQDNTITPQLTFRQRSSPSTIATPSQARNNVAQMPISRPWAPEQTRERSKIPPQFRDRETSSTAGFPTRLQAWQHEPEIQGPYHGIVSVPRVRKENGDGKKS